MSILEDSKSAVSRSLLYVQLALRPTPIHQWHLPGVPSGYIPGLDEER